MSQEITKPGPRQLGEVRRRAVSISGGALVSGAVEVRSLRGDTSLPLLVEPVIKGVRIVPWATQQRDFINNQLLQHGAVLFRNFADSVVELEQFVRAVSGESLEYQDQSSPRSKISGNIYTSTEYPANQCIHLHNENSYSFAFPLKLFFACLTPAAQGGETPLADCRRVFHRIDPAIRERFMEKKVMYVRNFGDGFGLDWKIVFQTTRKSVVEDYCRQNKIKVEWKGSNCLRTKQVRPAIARHPRTGDLVWFNHAVFFHVTTLEPQIRQALLSDFAEEDLPTNTYYGDGSRIEAAVLDDLREAYRQETTVFRWQAGDILMLDNMLTAHGRAPYIGARKVVVSMAEPLTHAELRDEIS
jgi:alpha-ketoglutarate-dependent taurine dioxygenase